MEPRNEKKTDEEARTEGKKAKPRRFQIIKLEERIAPGAMWGCREKSHGNPGGGPKCS